MTRTKAGTHLYNGMMRACGFLGRHIWLYHLLSYTWGVLMTAAGWLTLLFCRLFLGAKIHSHGPAHYVMIGDNWGGLEMGNCFLVADNMGDSWTAHTKNHELGHNFQNAVLGPFIVFVVMIPSACRYWHQRISRKRGRVFPSDWYDSAWFEGSASDAGTRYMSEHPDSKPTERG